MGYVIKTPKDFILGHRLSRCLSQASIRFFNQYFRV